MQDQQDPGTEPVLTIGPIGEWKDSLGIGADHDIEVVGHTPVELTGDAKRRLHGQGLMVGIPSPPAYKKVNIEDLYTRSLDRQVEFYGIDGCRAGWFYMSIDANRECRFGILEKFSNVDLFLDRAELVLVDIPIGLVSAGNTERWCDREARRAIKPRGSSVFPAPARAALSEPSYAEGSEANFQAVGRKLSTQSWAIVPKIREVDDYMRARPTQGKIREMHPEVAFWALNDRKSLLHGKKKREGAEERLAVLTKFLPHARECYEAALNTYKRKDVAADDILDAMVGAVTAMHFPNLATLPESPAKDEAGLPMEMVYAPSLSDTKTYS